MSMIIQWNVKLKLLLRFHNNFKYYNKVYIKEMADCWIGIRIFHILLGLLLFLNWLVFHSAVLWGMFGVLGAGAAGYHTWRLFVPGTLCSK